MLERCQHTNILGIVCWRRRGSIAIFSYCPEGDLHYLPAASKDQFFKFASGIASGLEYLHKLKVLHRDIKPANIFLQGELANLGDFGISLGIPDGVTSGYAGTPGFMAPEVAFGRFYRLPADVWQRGQESLSIVLVSSGSCPIASASAKGVRQSLGSRSLTEPLTKL
mmetsp:Transcript_84383/g.176613  ORF Transcript_84383/g.176613 Transcript_84383/m.176613 type:complete len:167 (+) Transcript_84383:198-698(+)